MSPLPSHTASLSHTLSHLLTQSQLPTFPGVGLHAVSLSLPLPLPFSLPLPPPSPSPSPLPPPSLLTLHPIPPPPRPPQSKHIFIHIGTPLTQFCGYPLTPCGTHSFLLFLSQTLPSHTLPSLTNSPLSQTPLTHKLPTLTNSPHSQTPLTHKLPSLTNSPHSHSHITHTLPSHTLPSDSLLLTLLTHFPSHPPSLSQGASPQCLEYLQGRTRGRHCYLPWRTSGTSS